MPAVSQTTGVPRGAGRALLQSAELVPLFYAALLFLGGIVIARFVYLRPATLLLSLLPLALLGLVAAWKAVRIAWLPIAVLWLMLGCWSAETEEQPVAAPAVTALSDGLLRTVEGTVSNAGPVARIGTDEEEDGDDERDKPADPQTARSITRTMQRIDLDINAAEVVTDSIDALVPIPNKEGSKLRLSVYSQEGHTSSISGKQRPLLCGDRLRAVVRMLPPETYHDPGVWSRATYLEGQGIAATASVVITGTAGNTQRFELIEREEQTAHRSFACRLHGWQQSADSGIASLPGMHSRLPSMLRIHTDDAAMLAALIVGDRTFLTRRLRVGFERTGSFHLIVVSGLHLAILAGCISWLARRLRIPRLAATAITIALSLAYALFTGFGLPVQRSFWMIALYLAGRLFYRRRSPLNVLGFATICLAAVSPRSIFDASLQMTVLSVASIAGIALPLLDDSLRPLQQALADLPLIGLDPRLPRKIAQFRVTLRLVAIHLEPAAGYRIAWRYLPWLVRSLLRVGELVFIAFVVELALVLPMALYFHRITVYALPINLLILPLLAILVPSAMLLLLALAIWPAAAVVPATLCAFVLHFGVFIVRAAGVLTMGDLRVPDPSVIQIAAALLLFVLAMQLARGGRLQRRVSFAAMLLMAATVLWPRPIVHPQGALFFQAIDVGQGDSLLLITPDGKTILVDAGGLGFHPYRPADRQSSSSSPSEFDIGEEVVSTVLWSRGIYRLDAVALTHAHQDHMGGLPAILRNFRPKEMWVGNNPPIAAYTDLLRLAAQQGTRIRSLHAGDALALGQVTLRVLAPQPGYQPRAEPSNNDSLVLQARFGTTSILLEGDAEWPEEQQLLTQQELQSTLLKVGHHGSLSSTRPAFLAKVAPAWAVISCGRRNRFGHPREEVLAELEAAHTLTFRTDLDGTVCFVLDGKSVTAQPMCSP